MLGRDADLGENALAVTPELAYDRRHLDRLRPRAEDAKDLNLFENSPFQVAVLEIAYRGGQLSTDSASK